MAILDANKDGLKYEIEDDLPQRTQIKVVGVGGGGSNAVAHMMNSGLEGVEFYVLNTDAQALEASPVPNKVPIGYKITGGRGAGADPSVGRQAALEDTERIVEILEGADIVFVTAGLGSGTGTGAAPVIASLARELSALTIAVVTKPFSFEGVRRMKQAERGLAELATSVDTVIAVPNDRLLTMAPRGTSLLEAFRMANDILRQAVQDIVEIITVPGLINRDYSDIRSTMQGTGYALMGTAVARGENAALEAARQAIQCELLEGSGIAGARNILLNITGSSRLGLHEVDEACSLIRQAAGSEDVQLNFGVVLNESMADAVKVTVIATGFGQPQRTTPEPVMMAAAASSSAWMDPPPVREPEPGPRQPESEHEPQPVTAVREPYAAPPEVLPPLEQAVDLDDLDTPAYLRQRRVVQ